MALSVHRIMPRRGNPEQQQLCLYIVILGQLFMVVHCKSLNCTALHCNELHCTVMYCTAMHCTLHCTALFPIIQWAHFQESYFTASLCTAELATTSLSSKLEINCPLGEKFAIERGGFDRSDIMIYITLKWSMPNGFLPILQ